MRKIGNLTSVATLLLVLLSLFCRLPEASAQDISLNATLSETKIFTGEQFTLSIEVESSSNLSIQLPQLPDIDGARVISANPSRSTSISIVNGRTSRSTTYIYTLIATGTGNYTIPPVSVQIDGELRQTDPLDFEVVEKGNLSEGREQMPDIFVQVEVNEEEPVTGQQIIASVVLYFKQGIEVTSFQPSYGWQTDGFWKEELENESQPRAESTILSGVRYRRATLIRYALFPSRSGNLTLSKYGLTVGMRSQPSRNDPFGSFFGSGTNQRRVELESDPVELSIRSLPDREESVSINAVGDFDISRQLNSREVRAGESVELETTIRGAGNIPLLRRPQYDIPDIFESFTPRETSDVERRGLTIQGEKIYTQQLVTRTPGTVEIPSQRVAVYDPENHRYHYETLPELSLNVLPARSAETVSAGAPNALQPVTGLAVWRSGSQSVFYQTRWFWIFTIMPFLALIIGWWRKRYHEKMMADSTFRRSQQSKELADQRLEKARKNLQKQESPKQVYNLLHKAISGYISDKLGLPEAGMSDRELIEAAQQQSVNGQTLKSLKSMLDKCNTFSYAPVDNRDSISADIEKTETLLRELKRTL